MRDSIDRQAAIDAIFNDKIDSKSLEIMTALGNGNEALTVNMTCDRHMQLLSKLPPADTDLSSYSDKLWKTAYERGKQEAERKKGKWIPCSEELPDEDYGNDAWQHSDFALVTVVDDGDDSNTFVDIARTENGEWKMGTPIDGDTEFPEWCHVIAWMPLPEPYMREPE